MPKHQIFLVHGMGQFERGWSSSTADLLNRVFDDYEVGKELRLSDSYDFPEITYSSVFEKWREQWKEDAADLAGKLKTGGLEASIADDLADVAQSASGEGFLRTHVLDVLFWRFIRQMAEEVTLEVLTQMDKHLKKFGSEPVRYSVICHSLGTSVMYESLHAGLTDSQPLLSSRLPQAFVAVSNCARLLWGKGADFYTSRMGPSPLDHKGMCNRFLDFGHELDPVWQVKPFYKPQELPPLSWFPNPSAQKAFFHDEIPADDIQDANVHALSHYLGHPTVHVPLIEALINESGAIADSERQAALAKWRANRLDDQLRNKAKKKLKALGKPAEDKWKEITATIQKLRESIANLQKADGEN
jgi:hypothetical protein